MPKSSLRLPGPNDVEGLMIARQRRSTGGCHFYSRGRLGRGAAGGDTGITALFKFINSKKNRGRLPESGILDSMPPESHVDADQESGL